MEEGQAQPLMSSTSRRVAQPNAPAPKRRRDKKWKQELQAKLREHRERRKARV